MLVGYCLWPDGGRIVVCDAGGTTVPRLGDPVASDQGGRGLRVVDAIAAQWDGFRIGQAQVVWCDIGKPLDGAAGDTWAWLARLLAEVPLAPLALERRQRAARQHRRRGPAIIWPSG